MSLSTKTYEDVFLEEVEVDRPDFTAIASDLAKQYDRIDSGVDDSIVTLLIESSQKAFENYTQSPLYQSEVTAKFSANSGNVRFQVPRKPIVSITSVQQDSEDLDYTREGNWLLIDDFDGGDGLIEVIYTAGLYEENDTVDPDIREGLLKYITSNYNDREDVAAMTISEMPNGSKSKWKSFRYMRL